MFAKKGNGLDSEGVGNLAHRRSSVKLQTRKEKIEAVFSCGKAHERETLVGETYLRQSWRGERICIVHILAGFGEWGLGWGDFYVFVLNKAIH